MSSQQEALSPTNISVKEHHEEVNSLLGIVAHQRASALTQELAWTDITRAWENFTLIEGQAGLLQMATSRPSQRASGLGLQLEKTASS